MEPLKLELIIYNMGEKANIIKKTMAPTQLFSRPVGGKKAEVGQVAVGSWTTSLTSHLHLPAAVPTASHWKEHKSPPGGQSAEDRSEASFRAWRELGCAQCHPRPVRAAPAATGGGSPK